MTHPPSSPGTTTSCCRSRCSGPYAVPSIGRLLDLTGEFARDAQLKVRRHGAAARRGVAGGAAQRPGPPRAIRRINQMHGRYDISNDDMRYVLSTFVVTPKALDGRLRVAAVLPRRGAPAGVLYYRELGRLMGIKEIPETYEDFEALLDGYEAAHFGFDEGGRRVADATLDLITTFPPNAYAPKWVVKRFALSLMDEALLRAFRYPIPTRFERTLFNGAMRLRARLLRLFPARSQPKWVSTFGYYRTYPAGYDIDDLGTFPGGTCPVHTPTPGSDEAAC